MVKPLNPYFYQQRRGINPHFSYMGENADNTNERQLQDSLLQEYIQQFGLNITYICRDPKNPDMVFGESAGDNFKHSFNIEMMMQDYVSGFTQRDAVAPFGYNMHDAIEMQCSFTRLNQELEIMDAVNTLGRDSNMPQPGDLLYFPLYKMMFEIRFVETKLPTYPLGVFLIYALTCYIYNPNSETFSTGIDDIDIINEFNKIYNEEPEGVAIQQEANELVVGEPNAWPNLLKP